MRFCELDEFRSVDSVNVNFAAVPNDFGDVALVYDDHVEVLRQNRLPQNHSSRFGFDQQKITIDEYPISEIIGDILKYCVNSELYTLDWRNLCKLFDNVLLAPNLALAEKIKEKPMKVCWLRNKYVLVVTNFGNVKIYELINSKWKLCVNLMKTYLDCVKNSWDVSECENANPELRLCFFQEKVFQFAANDVCTTTIQGKELLFVSSKNHTVSIWNCCFESSLNVEYLSILKVASDQNISCLKCHCTIYGYAFLLVGYTNGNVQVYVTSNGTDFEQSIDVYNSSDKLPVNYICAINDKCFLIAKVGFILLSTLNLEQRVSCNKMFSISPSDISGILRMDDFFIVSDRFMNFKVLDPVALTVSKLDVSFKLNEKPNWNTNNVCGLFKTYNNILCPIVNRLDDCITGKKFVIIPILKRDDLHDDPLSRLCQIALTNDNFDNHNDLFQILRIASRNESKILYNYLQGCKSLLKLNTMSLSLYYRLLKLYEEITDIDNLTNFPATHTEIRHALIAKHAVKLLKKIIIIQSEEMTNILAQSFRTCQSYLKFFLSQNYHTKFFDKNDVIEVNNLLSFEHDYINDLDQKCILCLSDLIYGIYCERYHATPICCLSLIPVVNALYKRWCPSCQSSVHDNFFDSADLVCCFCQVSTIFF